MMSVAETCRFKIDLRSGFVEALCSLAVSNPHHETDDSAASNGRIVLTRAEVSVRFRPGGGGGGRRRQRRCVRRLRTTRLTRSRSATLPPHLRAIWTIPFSIMMSTAMTTPSTPLPLTRAIASFSAAASPNRNCFPSSRLTRSIACAARRGRRPPDSGPRCASLTG